MVFLMRENKIRRLINERLREFTILDICRADPAVFAVPWVPDLTPEERKFEREYREQRLIELRAFLRRTRNAKGE